MIRNPQSDDELDDELDTVSPAPVPPPRGARSAPARAGRLKHMVKTGSYRYKGKVWSQQVGQIQATGNLSDADVEYLLRLRFTMPSKDASKRRVIDRFRLIAEKSEPPDLPKSSKIESKAKPDTSEQKPKVDPSAL